MKVILITAVLVIFDQYFIAKSHSKSFSFQNKLNKLSAHTHVGDDDHNDINHHDDDDNDNHYDHNDYGHHYKSKDISITKPINVHVENTPLIKNPSKKVVTGNTISQLIAFKQFIVNSVFNLLKRPAKKVSFGIHYSKDLHPITASTTMHGIVYSGEDKDDDDEHYHDKEESIIIANSPQSSSGRRSTSKPRDSQHKLGLSYHNFYSNTADNIMAPNGHHLNHYYETPPHKQIKFEFIPNTPGVHAVLY